MIARLHSRPAGLPEAVSWCGWCGTASHKSMPHKCAANPGGKALSPGLAPVATKRPPAVRAGALDESSLAAQLAAAGYFDTTHAERPEGVDARSCFRREQPWGLRLTPERGFRGDVVFLVAGLKVEIVGGAHFAGRAKGKADVEREGLSATCGLRSLPLTVEQVRSGEAVALVRAALGKGGA